MKNLLSIILTATLIFACGESMQEAATVIAKDSSWAIRNLQGMVQSIEETTFSADENGTIGEMDSCCIETDVFNEQGYRVSFSEKDSKGNDGRNGVTERREDGQFISAKNYKNGKQIWSRTVTFDAEGNALYTMDADSSGQNTYYYSDIKENEDGLLMGGKMHKADSTFMGNWSRKYTNGIRTGSGWENVDGIEMNDYTGELNEKGFVEKMTVVKKDKEGSTTEVRTFTYDSFDDAGNWTQRSRYDDGKLAKVQKRKYTYFKKS